MIAFLKRHWLPIVITISVSIFIMIIRQDFFIVKNNEMVPVEDVLYEVEDNAFVDHEQSSIIVDVKGEVVHPGIYEVAVDARVNDVIELAGGFSTEADQLYVNLAQKVYDEMLIIVPKIGESGPTEGDPMEGTIINAGTDKVRINYATQEEIETLTGIGPSKAQAIIQHREEHGFFKQIEDLLQISGIGEKTLEKIKDDIQIQ